VNTVRPIQSVQIEYSVSEEKMNGGKANFDMGLLTQGRAQIQVTISDAFEIEISRGGYRKFGPEI